MAEDDAMKRPNGVLIQIEDGDGEVTQELTLYTILNRLISAIFFPDPHSSSSLLHRIKFAISNNFPLLPDASKNTARNILLWTRRGSPLRALLVISSLNFCGPCSLVDSDFQDFLAEVSEKNLRFCVTMREDQATVDNIFDCIAFMYQSKTEEEKIAASKILNQVGTITLLTLTGLSVFMLFFVAATINAVIILLLMTLAAAGGFLALFFACVAAIYVGALSIAVFVISTATISAIVAVLIATGWIGFFWMLWLATSKSLRFAKHSFSLTGSVVTAYSTASHTHHDVSKKSD